MDRGQTLSLLSSHGGDAVTTLKILDLLNSGKWTVPETQMASLAEVDGDQVRDLTRPNEELTSLGWKLLPKTALGILNGGSATSYVDRKKNLGIAPGLGDIYEPLLNHWADELGGVPKALAPAFFQPDGNHGGNFLELKVRALLLKFLALGEKEPPVIFQMTSPATHQPILEALDKLNKSPWLSDLLTSDKVQLPRFLSFQQELIGAFTPKDSQGIRNVFFTGHPPAPLLLPGGHGQNFRVLEGAYHTLLNEGYEYAYLTNVDNLGALPDPVEIVLVRDGGYDAGFDFSFRTPVDVKGGILFRDVSGRLQCGDIGVAVPSNILDVPDSDKMLFNCATGVFRLDKLVPQLDWIQEKLPLRLSEQDKDTGRYAQAEQVSWEVIGILPRPVIFGVPKKTRFLAAKMIVESFLTSGLELDNPVFRKPELSSWKVLAQGLYEGLKNLLSGPYGLVEEHGIWRPLTVSEIFARIEKEGRGWLNARGEDEQLPG